MSRLNGHVDLRKYHPTIYMDSCNISIDELYSQSRERLCEINRNITQLEDKALEILKVLMNRKISQTGKATSILPEEKQKIYQTILQAVRENRPVDIHG